MLFSQILKIFFLAVITAVYGQEQECPNINKYVNTLAFQGYYVQNMLVIPKTNILIVNTLKNKPNESNCWVYYIDLTSGEVINILMPPFGIIDMRYYEPTDQVIALNQNNIMMLDLYSFKIIKQFCAGDFYRIDVIQGTRYLIVLFNQNIANIFDVVDQVYVSSIDDSQFTSTLPSIPQQRLVKSYNLSTEKTLVVISSDTGVVLWIYNISTRQSKRSGEITESRLPQGAHYWSFQKHPTQDILFLVGASQTILAIQLQDIEAGTFKKIFEVKSNLQSEFFENIVYKVMQNSEMLYTYRDNKLYMFLVSYSSDFSTFNIQQQDEPSLYSFEDILWIDNNETSNIFISSKSYVTAFNYQTKQQKKILYIFGNNKNTRYLNQYQDETDKYVLLDHNQLRIYERDNFEFFNDQLQKPSFNYRFYEDYGSFIQVKYTTNEYFIKATDANSDYIITFSLYPLSSPYYVIDIKQKYQLSWSTINSPMIDAFFFQNAIWVVLPNPKKPNSNKDYLVTLINCKTQEIYYLKTNQADDNTNVFTSFAFASLDDPNNQELIAFNSQDGTIYTWDLSQQNFPLIFSTNKFNCGGVSNAVVVQFETVKRLVYYCSQDKNLYQVDHKTGDHKVIRPLTYSGFALKGVSSQQLLIVGDFNTQFTYVYKYNSISDQFNLLLQFNPLQTPDNLPYVVYIENQNILWIQYLVSNVFYDLSNCLKDNAKCLQCTIQHYFQTTNVYDQNGYYGSGLVNSPYTTAQSFLTSMLKAQMYQISLFNVSNMRVIIKIFPDKQLPLNSNLMNFDFNNIISLQFQSQQQGTQASIVYTNYLFLQNYYSVYLKDAIIYFNLEVNNNCGLKFLNVMHGVALENIQLVPLVKPSIAQSCQYIQTDNSIMTILNYKIKNEDFTNHEQIISSTNNNKITLENFSITDSIFGDKFSVLNQNQSKEVYINNLEIVGNTCSSPPQDSINASFLFTAGLFQINGMTMSNNMFCKKSIFYTQVSFSQTNSTFIFSNVTAKNNKFQVKTTYIFFNALYSLLISPNHVLKLQDIYFKDNSLSKINNDDLEIAQYFQTIQIADIILQNVTLQNHFDIQLGYIENAKTMSVSKFNCSNDEDYQSNTLNQITASCLQMYEIQKIEIEQINSLRKKQIDSSLISLKNYFTKKSTFSMKTASFSDLNLMQANVNNKVSPIYLSSNYQIDVTLDYVTFNNNDLKTIQNSQSQSVSAIQLINFEGTFNIQNSNFLNSYSQSVYGFIQTQTKSLILDSVVFTNSSFSNSQQQELFKPQGGFINAQLENLKILNTHFSQATASKGGFLYLNQFGNTLDLNIKDSIFSEGYATIDGGAIFIDSGNKKVKLNCSNCQFQNIYTLMSQASTIGFLKYYSTDSQELSKMTFEGGYIKNVKGNQDNYFIDVINTDLELLNIKQILSEQFNSNTQPHLNYTLLNEDQQQAIISNLQNSNLLIQNCNISDIQKTKFTNTSPLILLSVNSNITIDDSTIKNLIFTNNVIKLISSSISLTKVIFYNINQQVNKLRFIQSSNYLNPSQNAASMISAVQSKVTVTQNSQFSNIICSSNCNGGALQLSQGIINIQQAVFQKVDSSFGGAIYISGLNQTNLISGVQFLSCNSLNDGGALYLNALETDEFQMTVSGSLFQSNNCQARGGALFINSEIQNSAKQKMYIIDSTVKQNQAAVGAGIYQQNLSVDTNKNTEISANIASQYGDDNISYPSKLKISNMNQFLKINNGVINNQQIIIDGFRSGGNLTNIQFILANDLDEIFFPVTQEQHDSFQIKANFDPNIKQQSSYILGSDTYAKYDHNTQTFKFNNITLSGIPGQSVKLQFSSDQIYTVDPIHNTFVKGYNFDVIINFRLCGAGEQIAQIDQVYQCQICPINYYSLSDSQQNCQECPEGASCLGGTNIVAKSGYWRKNQNSDLIISCDNQESNCLGGNYGDSTCFEGHIGALCEECDIYGEYWPHSYAKSGKYSCTRCDLIQYNILIVIALTIWTLVSITLAIKGDINQLKQKLAVYVIQRSLKRGILSQRTQQQNIQSKSIMSLSKIQDSVNLESSIRKQVDTINFLKIQNKSGIFIKMFTNYLQIVGSIATFNLSIPSGVFSFPQSIGQPLQQTMNSLDCALKDIETEVPIVYLRLLFSLTLPAIYLTIFVILMMIYYFYKLQKLKKNKNKDSFPWYILTTASIFLVIFVQPDLVSQSIATLSCRQIGDTQYVLSNITFECYTKEHSYYAFGLALPMLILWVLIIPAFLFYLLKKNRQNINNIKNKLRYQFLYKEYSDHAYYWEFVKMAEKLLIILSLNFYSQSIVTKGILVFTIITAYGILSMIIHPYQESEVNQIDVYSTNVCAVTILLGVFIYDNNYEYLVYISLILILIINIWFIIKIISKIAYNYKDKLLQTKQKALKYLSKKFNYFQKYVKEEKSQKINPEIKKKFQNLLKKYQQLKFEQKQQIFVKYLEKLYGINFSKVQSNISENEQNQKLISQNQSEQCSQKEEIQSHKLGKNSSLILFNNITESIVSENVEQKGIKDKQYFENNQDCFQKKPQMTLSEMNLYNQQSNQEFIQIDSEKIDQVNQINEQIGSGDNYKDFLSRSPIMEEKSSQRNQLESSPQMNLISKDSQRSTIINQINEGQNKNKKQQNVQSADNNLLQQKQYKLYQSQRNRESEASLQLIQEGNKDDNNNNKKDSIGNGHSQFTLDNDIANLQRDLKYNTQNFDLIQSTINIIYDQDINLQINE